jgi:hypothetical protein
MYAETEPRFVLVPVTHETVKVAIGVRTPVVASSVETVTTLEPAAADVNLIVET